MFGGKFLTYWPTESSGTNPFGQLQYVQGTIKLSGCFIVATMNNLNFILKKVVQPNLGYGAGTSLCGQLCPALRVLPIKEIRPHILSQISRYFFCCKFQDICQVSRYFANFKIISKFQDILQISIWDKYHEKYCEKYRGLIEHWKVLVSCCRCGFLCSRFFERKGKSYFPFTSPSSNHRSTSNIDILKH